MLRIPRLAAKAKLEARVELGAALLDRDILDDEDFRRIQQDVNGWSEHNYQLLRNLFTSDEFAKRYRGIPFGTLGGVPTLEEIVAETRLKIDGFIGSLRATLEALDAIEEDPSTTQLGAAAGTKSSPAFPAEPRRNPVATTVKVFISHSSSDTEVAGALANLMREAFNLLPEQIRCTSVVTYALRYGADPNTQLRDEVISAPVVLGLISSASIESSWVLFELGARWGKGTYFVAILPRGVDFSILPEPIRQRHALRVDGKRPADEDKLYKLISEMADEIGMRNPSAAQYRERMDEFLAIAARAP